ncbi:protein gop [Klebsiella aerogenes]|nr:protein gop [Klebsiella aerogenes]
MLNHIYGIVGIVGTLVTIVTSYIRNQELSQWLLVCSGWLAALLIGWFTHRTIKILSKDHKEAIISNDGIKQTLIVRNETLTTQLTHALEQKEKMEGIAAYLATQNPQISAMPRAIARQENTEPGGN